MYIFLDNFTNFKIEIISLYLFLILIFYFKKESKLICQEIKKIYSLKCEKT